MKKKNLISAAALFAVCTLLFVTCGNGTTDNKSPSGPKAELNTAITDAEALLAQYEDLRFATDDAAISGGLSTGDEYVRPADYTAYTNAIAAAKSVYNNSYATEAQITAAIAALTAAKGTFNDAINTVGTVNRAPLNTAISDAEALLASIPEYADDAAAKDAGLEAGEEYATEADRTAYSNAIAAAQAVADADNPTQAQIDRAVRDLADATTAFNRVIKAVADKPGLTAAVTAAETLLAGVPEYADDDAAKAGGLSDGDKYAVAADRTAYQQAITAAKAVADDDEATQEEVDAAIAALAAATTAFNNATHTVGVVNLAVLTAAITAAEDLLAPYENIQYADDDAAKDDGLIAGNPYITPEDYAAYSQAIAAAQTVADDTGATQAQVDSAVTTLAAATTAFNAAKKVVALPALISYWPLVPSTRMEAGRYLTDDEVGDAHATWSGPRASWIEDADWGRQVFQMLPKLTEDDGHYGLVIQNPVLGSQTEGPTGDNHLYDNLPPDNKTTVTFWAKADTFTDFDPDGTPNRRTLYIMLGLHRHDDGVAKGWRNFIGAGIMWPGRDPDTGSTSNDFDNIGFVSDQYNRNWDWNFQLPVDDLSVYEGKWIHYALVHSPGSTRNADLYIDGEFFGTSYQNGGGEGVPGEPNLDAIYIGGKMMDTLFQGRMADLRLYGSELTPDEIKADRDLAPAAVKGY